MAIWKDKLRRGSFKGIPFFVEAGGISAGRRIQTHEYPLRDKPFTEDLGKATREITVTAFLLGENAISESERLLAALESPGPGTLVHPWLGQMKVVAQPARMTFNREAGLVQVEFSFVEAGELAFPSAGVSTGIFSQLKADLFETASLAEFLEKFGIEGYPNWVSDDAVSAFGLAISAAGGNFSFIPGFTSNKNTLIGEIAGLFGVPATLASRIISLFRDSAPSSDLSARYMNGLVSAAGKPELQNKPPYNADIYSPSRQKVRENQNAINGLVRQAMLSEAVRVSSVVPITIYDDAIKARDGLTKALDNESLVASDTLYDALTDARIAVHKDLTSRAQDAARLRTFTPPEVMPALAIAYDLYESAERAQEIVDRNRIIHPGFVPVKDLKVLAR